MKGLVEVRIAERPKTLRGLLFSLRVHNGGHLSDVTPRQREESVAGARLLPDSFVGLGRGRLDPPGMPCGGQPGGVPQQVDSPSIADSETGACPMAVKLAFTDHFPERGGVQQTAELDGSQLAGVNGHRRRSP
jgi:hypothetical protein